MDSRYKIYRGPRALDLLRNLQSPQVVSAIFDPLLAHTSARLEALKRPGASLVVVLGESAAPILPVQARAELVAALRCVDFVVIPEGVPIPVEFSLDEEHESASRQFIGHVIERIG